MNDDLQNGLGLAAVTFALFAGLALLAFAMSF